MTKTRLILITLLPILITGISACSDTPDAPEFDGEQAFAYVEHQVSFGPRYIGSEGHRNTQQWIEAELQKNGWVVEIQPFDFYGETGRNIFAYKEAEKQNDEWVILGAHYDTRIFADEDPDPVNHEQPVLGANDGASGVGVLLELSRILPDLNEKMVWLVFFDAEDNGNIRDYPWIAGSTYFVEQLEEYPDKVIVIDMIGDRDQNIYLEITSDKSLAVELWRIAESLEIDTFILEEKYAILDDHTPFLRKGISTANIIDFDYPYWHTTQDTLDKISSQSLQNIGDVLLAWLSQSERDSNVISK